MFIETWYLISIYISWALCALTWPQKASAYFEKLRNFFDDSTGFTHLMQVYILKYYLWYIKRYYVWLSRKCHPRTFLYFFAWLIRLSLSIKKAKARPRKFTCYIPLTETQFRHLNRNRNRNRNFGRNYGRNFGRNRFRSITPGRDGREILFRPVPWKHYSLALLYLMEKLVSSNKSYGWVPRGQFFSQDVPEHIPDVILVMTEKLWNISTKIRTQSNL